MLRTLPGRSSTSAASGRISPGGKPPPRSDGGWLGRIHPDDRTIVADTREAATNAAEHGVRYRLLRPDDPPRWVGASGVPSFGTRDERFIGFLDSIAAHARRRRLN